MKLTTEYIALFCSETDLIRIGVFEGFDGMEEAKAFLMACANESIDGHIKTWRTLLKLCEREPFVILIFEREDGQTGEVYSW
jgi:hypothetical protein